MHEVSLAEGISEIVERTARANRVKRVSAVKLDIGELAGVDVPSLEFAWTSVRRGTVAEKAPLVIRRTEGRGFCFECGETSPMHGALDVCPRCGGKRFMPCGGEEMRVTEILEAEDLNAKDSD